MSDAEKKSFRDEYLEKVCMSEINRGSYQGLNETTVLGTSREEEL
eukprot:CAMPEP_0170556884 /NCGR_PEP_ID=MMETSP0211-20121228/19032_1 /TAXON_ID=311385 /ORGANISM="Pseudokeronopsis sp., Strain OXSARD2" /LENGTH=44 /DNA_ID= /DNA_START= /DNA_END= /DNA_ORIENTATION=